MGMSLDMSASNHPQTDGQSEKINDTVLTQLRTHCGDDEPTGWIKHTKSVQLSITGNTTVAGATGYPPIYFFHSFALEHCLVHSPK